MTYKINSPSKASPGVFAGLLLLFIACLGLFVGLVNPDMLKNYLIMASLNSVFGLIVMFVVSRRSGDLALPFIFAVLLLLGNALQATLGNISGADIMIIFPISAVSMAGAVFADRFINKKIFADREKLIITLSAAMVVSVLLVLLIFGRTRNNTKAWISLFGYSFQATELLKLFFPVFLTAVFGSQKLSEGKKLLLGTGLMTVVAGLMVVLGEMGTVLVLGVTYLMIVFVLTGNKKLRIRYFAAILILAVLAVLAVYLIHTLFSSSSGRIVSAVERLVNRWNIFLHPDVNEQDNLQLIDAQRAVESGGFLGSRSNNYIINQKNDMIWPYMILRMGVLPAFCVIGAFVYIYLRFQRTSADRKDRYSYIFSLAVSSVLLVQTLIISFGSLNFIPLTGVPLPLLSEGGASMVVNFALFGVLFSHSCRAADSVKLKDLFTRKKEKKETAAEPDREFKEFTSEDLIS